MTPTPFEHFIPNLLTWLKSNIGVFGLDLVPCLTHNDFSNTNILVLDNGHISGVVDLDNILVGNCVADIYRIYPNFKGNQKDLALKTFFKNYSINLPKNFDKQIKFYEVTHVLAYINCWIQIVESYTKEDLKNMVEKMNKDIKSLLSISL